MAKYLVTELKGYSFRLLDLESGKEIRAMKKEYDLCVGSLIEADIEVSGGSIDSMKIISEIVGDSSKPRVELSVSDYKIGDLYEGVPILNFGKSYAKKGVKVAYAYFK